MYIVKSDSNDRVLLLEERDFINPFKIQSKLIGHRFNKILIPEIFSEGFDNSSLYKAIEPAILIGGKHMLAEFIKY